MLIMVAAIKLETPGEPELLLFAGMDGNLHAIVRNGGNRFVRSQATIKDNRKTIFDFFIQDILSMSNNLLLALYLVFSRSLLTWSRLCCSLEMWKQ